MVEHESSHKRYQQFTKLADMIRTQFTLKMKWTLPLREVVQALNDSQRGQFQAHTQIHEQVAELCQMIPEWIQVKEVSGARYLKVISQTITSQKVYETLKSKILRDQIIN